MRLTPFRMSTAALAAGLALAAPALRAESLQELYIAAHAYDANYLSARKLADSAEYRVAQVEGLAKPTASLTASLARNQFDYPTTSFIDPNTGLVAYDNGNGGGTANLAQLNARYPLFNKPNRVTIEQARRSLASAQADLDTAEQDLILRVAQAYFDVLAAQDTLSTTRQAKAAITEQLASAKRNFEVGTATITDTREAQARYDLATAQELQAENDLRTKRIALDTLVGRANVAPNPLAVPVVLPASLPADPNLWVATADNVHPAIRRSKVALDVAKLEVEKARATALPTVDAVAAASEGYNIGVTASPRGHVRLANVGVQLNWQFYDGGQVQNRVKETMVLEDKSREDLEATRRAVAQATRTAFFGEQSLLAQVTALEAAEGSSKLALEATQLGYRVGVRVNLDVLNAQTQLYTTQRDLAKARYDVIVGSLRLRQAAGELGPGDVEAVNRLLAR